MSGHRAKRLSAFAAATLLVGAVAGFGGRLAALSAQDSKTPPAPANSKTSPAPAKPPGELTSGIVSFSQAAVASSGAFGEFRTFFTGETHSMRDLLSGAAVIQPGQEIHPPHQHVDEEFLYLAKGEGTWSLDGKESPAHEGDLLYVAPWVMHGLKNTSSQPLTFLVLKWNGKGVTAPPKPTAGTR